jgi:hypothetical protein
MRILAPIANDTIDFDVKHITCDEGKVIGMFKEEGKIWLEIKIEDLDVKKRIEAVFEKEKCSLAGEDCTFCQKEN